MKQLAVGGLQSADFIHRLTVNYRLWAVNCKL